MNIHLVAGARPNFMKIAPLYHALKKESWANPRIVHTGQHYDIDMSDAIFQDLGLPEPDVHLGVGSGTHGKQTGQVLISYERVLFDTRPDLVVVVGDVNSTCAAALAAVKLGIKTAHLEAGLRSFDRTMPEEINRLVTDVLADILWTPSPDGDDNLIREGVSRKKIFRVGNIMIDSLEMLRDTIESVDMGREVGVSGEDYCLVTLHRPSNVDNRDSLEQIRHSLIDISNRIPVVFPIHPRTRKNLEKFGLMESIQKAKGFHVLTPQSYIRFMSLVFNCRIAITDSGGIQEETTYLGIPCVTLRPNTERPITITHGTNKLCGARDLDTVVDSILSGRKRYKHQIEYWDGKTSERIIDTLKVLFPEKTTV